MLKAVHCDGMVWMHLSSCRCFFVSRVLCFVSVVSCLRLFLLCASARLSPLSAVSRSRLQSRQPGSAADAAAARRSPLGKGGGQRAADSEGGPRLNERTSEESRTRTRTRGKLGTPARETGETGETNERSNANQHTCNNTHNDKTEKNRERQIHSYTSTSTSTITSIMANILCNTMRMRGTWKRGNPRFDTSNMDDDREGRGEIYLHLIDHLCNVCNMRFYECPLLYVVYCSVVPAGFVRTGTDISHTTHAR